MSKEQDEATDVLGYTKRNEFTSEIYKIEVKNMGIFGIGQFKKLLKKTLNLDASKIKSPHHRDFAFVCFRSQEDQTKAISLLNGYKWKGKVLAAVPAKATADPFMKRKNEDSTNTNVPVKRHKNSIEATCPLAGIPYEEQIEQKRSQMEEVLKSFGKQLISMNRDAKRICFSNESDMPCEFLGIKQSPMINGYRNKSEFTIGKNSDGETVVGFRLGSYADGCIEVSSVEDVPQLPESAKLAAKSFQEFVQQSKFTAFNPLHNSGHFRQLMVRTSDDTGEIMLVAGVYSSNLTDDEVVELKKDLTDFYKNYDKSKMICSSLYYQDLKRREPGQTHSPVDHLLGTTHITDVIHGLRFRISPLAFFQINTKGAEVLYQETINLLEPKEETVVLDICCGTGTIGLCFAKHCKKVLGVDIIPDAINDAKFNATENKVENCTFYTGNANDYIKSLAKEVVYSAGSLKDQLDLVAIIDPPRAGLHKKSIAAIRESSHLKRLVYISCKPEDAKRNWIELSRPESKAYKGQPFFPTKAVAVDMFPHTAHTELVILFERKEIPEENEEDESTEDASVEAKAVNEVT